MTQQGAGRRRGNSTKRESAAFRHEPETASDSANLKLHRCRSRLKPRDVRQLCPDPMDSDSEMRQIVKTKHLEEMCEYAAGDSGCESLGCIPFCPDCVSRGSWGDGGGDEETQSCRLEDAHREAQHNLTGRPLTCPVAPLASGPWSFTPVSTSDAAIASTLSSLAPPLVTSPIADACTPFTFTCISTSSAWGALTSTSRNTDGDPSVSAAAHLHLLGESLSLIGHHLQETNKVLCVSSSLSLLLDSLLCALAPLVSLTAQIPELRSCSQHNLAFTLENIAYLMPGL